MIAHWRMFAAYNAWANRRLYAACASLPAGDFTRDGGAFFGSVKGTLNHILVTDRIWLGRFMGEPNPAYRLDDILFEDFEGLRVARVAEDLRLGAWIDGLGPADLAGDVRYRRQTSPAEIVQPLTHALAHLFNHQTHHRGQVHALLTRFAGAEAGPALDLAFFQREAAT